MVNSYGPKAIALHPHQIFVFGSNTEGRHGKGAALFARQHYGAVYGQPAGRQGQSYAIVTKDLRVGFCSVPKEQILAGITEFYEYAREHPDLEFWVAYADFGKPNLNGYSHEEMAELFAHMKIPDNVLFSDSYAALIEQQAAVTH